MKSEINFDELVKKINEFRMSNLKKTFTRDELYESLYKLGFNKVLCHYMMKNFPFEKMGTSKLYGIPKDPIHKSVIISTYNHISSLKKKSNGKRVAKQSLPDENDAWQLLINKGLVKKKFNIELLKTRYPKIYLECMSYEVVNQ